jgi:DNA modification methylase
MQPTIETDKYSLYLGDCLDVMREMEAGSVDAVITDPPYPDYYVNEYKYFDGILLPFSKLECKQFIFWTSKIDFPLDYTAIHIWDKKTGAGSEYERIFERHGNKNYKVCLNLMLTKKL